ncbi:MAG: zinc metalloprotease HtpX [Candidatus Omnitrophota bacterium]
MKNILKTTFLLTFLTLLLIWLGGAIGGRGGVMFAFILSIVMNFVAYWFSDKIVLKMYKARPLQEAEAPGIYAIVNRLTVSANIPMPQIYLVPSKTPNAFATGRNPEHAVVAVTQGIMQILNEEELEGVLAHEIAHIKNRDILLQSVVATVAGAISMLAYMARWAAVFGGVGGRGNRKGSGNIIGLLAMTIVVPMVAMIVQLAISRTREYGADSTGAEISRKPLALANALAKLSNANKQFPMPAEQSTAHMFIVNPLKGGGLRNLFSTHPPMEERIRRLKEMEITC